MDVSDLRQKILRALDAARVDAANKRGEADAARVAYETFLRDVAAPLLRQAQAILKAEKQAFTVHSPADSVRLAADAQADTFVEFVLDTSGEKPQVMCRVSTARGAKRVRVEERPLVPGKPIKDLGDQDVAALLVSVIPLLVK